MLFKYKDSLYSQSSINEDWYRKIAKLHLKNSEYDSAKKYYQKAIHSDGLERNSKKYARMLNNIGVLYYSIGKVDSSIYYYTKAKEIFKAFDNKFRMAYINNNLGVIYKEKGLYDLALNYFLEGIQYLSDMEQSKALFSFYNNIAMIYSSQEDYDNSLRYQQEALKIARDLNLAKEESLSLNNIGTTYSKRDNIDSALHYYLKAIELKNSLKHNKRIASTLNNVGLIYLKRGEYGQAKKYLENALDIHSNTTDETGKTITLNNLSRLYYSLGKYDDAISYLEQARAIIDKQGLLEELKENLEIRLDVQEALKLTEQALSTSKHLAVIKDSLLNEDKIKALTQMQTRYETHKKEQEIELLQQKQTLQETNLKLRQIWIWALTIFSLLVLAIVLLIWTRWRSEKKDKHKIEVLMQELHHRVKNNLQLLSSIFSLQSRLVRDKDALEAVKSGENRVNAMAIIHQKLYRQTDARTVNVNDYLTELIHELAESYGVDHQGDSIFVKMDNLDLDVDKVIPIGLIVNELVNNAFKYAFPQSLHPKLAVLLERTNGRLELSIQDNGEGFQKKETGDSMGINIVETLARQLGAKIHWENREGVKFKLDLDLNVV
ncbi:tetratricopeptide repeat protein [Fulvivirga sp. M361]|uniref:tetratricopeptide repeat-containing sensor histidine kinase n=1 Tax=Fulvivirga sp. M361 TaxID=2594266 RepID=UPI001624F65B|nr:tetratricopeptide repeat protein [Fulvivirga sp. M361]